MKDNTKQIDKDRQMDDNTKIDKYRQKWKRTLTDR